MADPISIKDSDSRLNWQLINITANVAKTGNLGIQVQHRFSLKKRDDATFGPETNHQVSASSLILFSWKKYWNLAPMLVQEIKNGFWTL